MPGFGSLAPDSGPEDDLLNRYYDPGTGMPAPGPDQYVSPKKWMLEPDLVSQQLGTLPKGVSLNDAGQPIDQETGEPIQIVPRPGVFPFIKKPGGGLQIVKPKVADIAAMMVRGPLPVEAEAGAVTLRPPIGLAKTVIKGMQAVPGGKDKDVPLDQGPHWKQFGRQLRGST